MPKPPEQSKREQVYSGEEIAGILKQLTTRKIRATIELRHDGSGVDAFTFYFTKINASDITIG